MTTLASLEIKCQPFMFSEKYVQCCHQSTEQFTTKTHKDS